MTFTGFEHTWAAQLGNLRNAVRQHVIASQLADHLDGVHHVLDVGCGQGTQLLLLAERGLTVTGVDPSDELLGLLRADADARGLTVSTISGDIDSLEEVLGDRSFDLVCAHGVLMYVDGARAAISALAGRVRPGGLLSFTVRNGDALAYRPGIRGDFAAALAAFDSSGYRNGLGIDARAHTRAEVARWCEAIGLTIEQWYGVRVLTDWVSADVQPESVDLAACLTAEDLAGRRDPYRGLGSMLHFVCRTGPDRPADREAAS